MKDFEINIQLKPGYYPVKQKARPFLLHLQKHVRRALKKSKKVGLLENVNIVDEDCSISTVVITVKNDKSVKIAVNSRKLEGSCRKRKQHLPNMEGELIKSRLKLSETEQ